MKNLILFGALAMAGCSGASESVSSKSEAVICNPYPGKYVVRPASYNFITPIPGPENVDVYRARDLVDKLFAPIPCPPIFESCSQYGASANWLDGLVGTRVIWPDIDAKFADPENALTTEERAELEAFRAESVDFESCEEE